MKLLDISIVEGRPPSLCGRQQKKVATESRVGDTYHTAVTYERCGLLTNLSAYTMPASLCIPSSHCLLLILFFLLGVLK